MHAPMRIAIAKDERAKGLAVLIFCLLCAPTYSSGSRPEPRGPLTRN